MRNVRPHATVNLTSRVTNQTITLFRGESGEAAALAKAHGISAQRRWHGLGFPHHDFARLLSDPPRSIVIEIGFVARHVLATQDASPLVSFTPDKKRAKHYALHSGTIQTGTIFCCAITLTKIWEWETFADQGSRLYEDERGRFWIHVSELHLLDLMLDDSDESGPGDPNDDVGYRKPRDIEAFFHGGDGGVVQSRGTLDNEYLMLGDLVSSDLNFEDVQSRRGKASRTENS